MSTSPKKPRTRRALGIAALTVVAVPTLGCMEAHTPPATDAQVSSTDASIPDDAVALADAQPDPLDAGVPVDAPPAIDAWADEDAGAADAYYYPDGIRG